MAWRLLMMLPEYKMAYQQVGNCSCFGCIVDGFDRNCLNRWGTTHFVHEVHWLRHVIFDPEGDGTDAAYFTGIALYRVVLLFDLDDWADFNEEEDGEGEKDDEDTEKTDDGLVIGDFLDFPVFEEEVDEFVLYFYCDVLLFVGIPVRYHFV
jgi:hypothetical protein